MTHAQPRSTIRTLLHAAFATGLLAAIGTTPARAQLDNDVQWALLSHSAQADRRPLCPLNSEAFDVIFQTARDDVSGARVGFDDGADGAGVVWVNAVKVGSRGPYDLWRASLPAGVGTRSAYVIEVTDGTDTDYLSATGVSDLAPAVGSWWTLDYTTLSHAQVGATPTAAGTVFKVWAPNATTALVRGTFNAWGTTNPLTKRGEHFVGFVPGARPGHKYKFFFNNSLWRTDARARQIDASDNSNSVIIDPLAYAWQHPNFAPAPRERWVVYQLHVGSFAGLNDPRGSFTRVSGYRDVALRADHLAELGVNAVMFNPFNEFPGELSGGYNPISKWAFERSYGTPDDLKFMIDQLHARGIAVLLDVVWNHFSSSDNYLWQYDGTQIYFDNPAVNTPWGAQADFDRPGVFDYFAESVEHVLGEYNMDGYRQDAVAEIVSGSQWSSGQRLIRGMMDLVDRRFSDSHVIGEIYNNSAWNTSTVGMNLDGQYHEAFKNAIRDAIGASSFGDPDMAQLAASIDGSGPNVEGEKVLNYYELHDDAWTLSGGQRAVRTIDTTAPHDDRYAIGRTKLGNGLTLLARGMPAILMGTEWLEDNGFEQQKMDWSHKTTYAPIFRFYQRVIGLRTSKPSLFANAFTRVFHVNDAANTLAFDRTGSDSGSFVIVANFGNADIAAYDLGLPRPGAWGVVLNSEETKYGGRGTGSRPGLVAITNIGRDGFTQQARLSLPAHGFLILQHQPEFLDRVCPADVLIDGVVNSGDLTAFLNLWFNDLANGTATSEFDGAAGVGSGDLTAYISEWFSALANGC